jgi:two-component system sensor histidine kinase UhpB
VREIARRLRPEALDDLGLRSALAALTLDLSSRTDVRIERRIAADLPGLSAEEELVVYRVAQEALSNAARHSGAERISVALRRSADGVELDVADDGRGFVFDEAEGGLGIAGMRERALLLGGELRIESRPEQGTTVRLRI